MHVIVLILITLVTTCNSIECNRLYTAVQLIQRQLDFFENTIKLIRSCDADVTSFLVKKEQIGLEGKELKESVVSKNLKALKDSMNNLIQKKNSVVKNLLIVMYSNESGICPEEVRKIKENLVTKMMEIKELAFRNMFSDSIRLGQDMGENMSKNHVDEGLKMLDPSKKDYDESITKLSEYLGLPIDLRSLTVSN